MLTNYDYLMLLAMFSISAAIGIYFGCFGSKQATTKEFLHGDKKMGILSIAISIAVSHFSGVSIMAIPADVYRFGGYFILANVSAVLVGLLSVYVYLPVFFKLQLSSSYEYLARRFDNRTKQLAIYLYLVSEIVFFPMLAYIPALALSETSGLNVNLTAFIVCGLCIFYTTIGGLKTVVWTDVFQFIVIILSLTANGYIGLKNSGGFVSVWKTSYRGGRLDILDFNIDLTTRDSFWASIFGYTATMASGIVIHQTGVQKYLSIPKFGSCVWSVIYSTICKCLVTTVCMFIGLEIYARYADCDPLISGRIRKHDHILPYFLTDVAAYLPGVLGLFVASIFSAALSSMSSLLNSMAGIIYNDLFKKHLKKEYSELTQSNILKLIVVVCGVACTGLVFLVEYLGPLLALSIALRGFINGPLLGMFTLGMLFPKTNSKGAFYGGLISLVSVSVLMVGTKYYEIQKKVAYPMKPLSIDGCDSLLKNVSMSTLANFTSATPADQQIPFLFRLSFQYYTLLGTLLTLIVGVVISYMTKKNEDSVDESLISPLCRKFLPKNCMLKGDISEDKGSCKKLIGTNSEECAGYIALW